MFVLTLLHVNQSKQSSRHALDAYVLGFLGINLKMMHDGRLDATLNPRLPPPYVYHQLSNQESNSRPTSPPTLYPLSIP